MPSWSACADGQDMHRPGWSLWRRRRQKSQSRFPRKKEKKISHSTLHTVALASLHHFGDRLIVNAESWNVGQSGKKKIKIKGKCWRWSVGGSQVPKIPPRCCATALHLVTIIHSVCFFFDPFPDRISHAAALWAAYSRPTFPCQGWWAQRERDTITRSVSALPTDSEPPRTCVPSCWKKKRLYLNSACPVRDRAEPNGTAKRPRRQRDGHDNLRPRRLRSQRKYGII